MSRLEDVNEAYLEVTKMMGSTMGPHGELLEIQKISVLHQISQTLAMLYDKCVELDKDEEVKKEIEGEWSRDKNGEYVCSACGEEVIRPSRVCPWCGAKMKEPPVCCSECDHCSTDITGVANTMGGPENVRIYGKCTANNKLLYQKITKARPYNCPLGFYKFEEDEDND